KKGTINLKSKKRKSDESNQLADKDKNEDPEEPPSKKKKKGKRKRKRKKNNSSEKPTEKDETVKEESESSEELEFEIDEGDSSDNDEELTGPSKLIDKMVAWNGLGLSEPILRALAEQGFVAPTEIQAKTLPAAIMGRRDILGAAETGSGKTLAFGIPILHRILEEKQKKEKMDHIESNQNESDSEESVEDSPDEDLADIDCVKVVKNVAENDTSDTPNPESRLYALVLTPTRELAMQVHKHLIAAAKYTGIKVAVVVGGMASQKQERVLSRRPEIVVATPGRLWELIQDCNPHLTQVNNIMCLAIDETDRMLEKGHFQELHSLLELLNVDESKKRRRQNFVFSATLTLVHDIPKYLKNVKKKKYKLTPGQKLQNIMTMLGITNPKVVDVTKESGTAGTLTEARIICTLEEKDFYLYYFIQRHKGRTLIFCNSISCVRRLAQLLTLLQCKPLPLHANMIQRQRLKNLDRFRINPHSLLLATDVAARGLDIPDVQHVIHYQVPRTSESYVHRSGRTARAQKEGLTLLLIEPSEVPFYTRLCRTLGRTKDLPLFPVASNALAIVKQRVALARELDQLELTTRRSNTETGWFRKTLSEMDMLVDEESVPRRMDDDENNKLKRLASVKRKQLSALLAKPIFVSEKLIPSNENEDANNAVQVLKSAVGMKVARRKKKKVKPFVKKKSKNKKIAKED
ncbi:hypothetical protein ANN_18151, partial [Periplaneta americana]